MTTTTQQHNHAFASLAAFANKLADVARREIAPHWRSKTLAVTDKEEAHRAIETSPVTLADRNAERAMRQLIQETYPAHGVIGEEEESHQPDAEYVWVLDPIDGTKSFITGKPLFTTLIGLCRKGVPVVGVIDQCVLDERWVGTVGVGTTLNGAPVSTDAAATSLSSAMLYATTPHMFAPGVESERFAAVRDAVKRPLYGCDGYAYGLLAAGFGTHLVVEADLGVYDYAALVPVVAGAGGVMSDWEGVQLSLANCARSRGRVVAAATPALHAAALELLRAPVGPVSVIKPHLRSAEPYKPPLDGRSSERHLLLDFNERTLPPPAHVSGAIVDYVTQQSLSVYPAYGDLDELIARYAGIPAEHCMFTNGSDQAIDLIIRCCCAAGTEAILPSPTFAMYEQSATAENLVIRRPMFTREAGFPTEGVLAAISPRTSLIILCNPNNPTGTEIPKADMLAIARAAPHAAILVDECYYEFMPEGTTMAHEVASLPNVFVTRTFSKTWGIPSLRLGYIITAKPNVSAICCVRGPYDINMCSVVAIRAALKEPQYVYDFVDELVHQSRPAFEAFLQRKGIGYWPSASNYLFIYVDQPAAMELKLRERGILVRPKKDDKGVTGLRISLGTMEQTQRLIDTLDGLL